MEATITANSYTSALKTISTLLGQDVDCMLIAEGNNLYIESSNPEAWLRVNLALASSDQTTGDAQIFTKFEFLNAIRPKGNMTLSYDYGDDRIEIKMDRSKGAIPVLDEYEVIITNPLGKVKPAACVPAELLISATGGTSFKPLVTDSSSPNAILDVTKGAFDLSSYDIYLGTHYRTENIEIKAKSDFRLTVEMDYWRKIVGCMSRGLLVLLGSDDKYFRVRTECFDLYHAAIDEDTQDVRSVITSLKEDEEKIAVIEFDGKDMVEAMDAAKGIIKAGSKEDARFKFVVAKGSAAVHSESHAGNMKTDLDIFGYDGEEELNFIVSSACFSDLLKLTRDDNIKYCPVRLTLLPQYVILESLKVPACSISPVLED